MLKFDPNKTKKISMTLQMEGVSNKKVDFEFIVEINNIRYSFPVVSDGMRLNIDIPKLSDVVKNDISNGEYTALIEAKIPTEDQKGYYVRPWSDNILIESSPEINVTLESEDITEKTDIKFSVSKPVEIEETKEKKQDEIIKDKIDMAFEETKEKTKNRFRKILED